MLRSPYYADSFGEVLGLFLWFSENTLTAPSKMLDKLKERLQAKTLHAQGKIDVSIMLNYDAGMTKEEFIERESEIFNGNITDLNGFGGYSFLPL